MAAQHIVDFNFQVISHASGVLILVNEGVQGVIFLRFFAERIAVRPHIFSDALCAETLDDESLPKSSSKEINFGFFKTPVTTVITASKPERKFVELLCKRENADLLSAWIKSRDRGFYEIEYTCRYGSRDSKSRRYYHDKFNPDFFLKIDKDGITYFLVIEIKDDDDDCEENKAKYKYALLHFAELNERLERQGIPERYIFHFLSPNAYDVFFQHLKDGSVLFGQGRFRCALENMLEDV